MAHRYFTRRCMAIHATLAVLLVAFVLLTRWQVARAAAGNTLSWAYAFEWPLFAGYAIYMWWQLIHDAPKSRLRPGPTATSGSAAEPGSTGGETDEGPSDAPVGWALGPPRPRRGAPVAERTTEAPARVEAGTDEDEDSELAAYNRYLARLSANGGRKTW